LEALLDLDSSANKRVGSSPISPTNFYKEKIMKVELSIKDDKELRQLIKDMIRGQVVNIARESLTTLISEAVVRKLESEDSEVISKAIRDTIYKQDLSNLFRKEMTQYFKEAADSMIYQHIEKVFNEKSLTDRVTKIMRKRFKFSVGVDDQ
jgi:vacuolar-type H+-ATPase subunit C/Vma6